MCLPAPAFFVGVAMNRRDFLKFLAQASAAAGLATVIGLPEIQLDKVELERADSNGMTLDHQDNLPPGFESSFYEAVEYDNLYISGEFW